MAVLNQRKEKMQKQKIFPSIEKKQSLRFIDPNLISLPISNKLERLNLLGLLPKRILSRIILKERGNKNHRFNHRFLEIKTTGLTTGF